MLFTFESTGSDELQPDTLQSLNRDVLADDRGRHNSMVARDERTTLNAVAREIGADQSGASRVVESAMTAFRMTVP